MPAMKVWLLASRPKTLWAAMAPVLIGTAMAYADGKAHWPSALLAAVAALLLQIGANFSNDYFDFVKGADDTDRLGPTRATQAGLVRPEQMKFAFIVVFALAALIGTYLVIRGGWPILLIGVLSILSGILYTAGPFPLGYYGLGDLFVFIFFGLVAVAGTYYVQALEINAVVLAAGVAPGLFSTAILTVNNLRDIHQDRRAGKKTLAVRFGERFARLEYLFGMLLPCLIPILLFFWTSRGAAAMAASLTFLLAIRPLKTIFTQPPGTIYNEVLAQTGKILFIFSLLFSVGWIL